MANCHMSVSILFFHKDLTPGQLFAKFRTAEMEVEMKVDMEVEMKRKERASPPGGGGT